jgi:S-formylglutathione hydrolase
MKFSVFVPEGVLGMMPVVFFLAGLTCTEETFMIKAAAFHYASKFGLVLVACDTSPRGTDVPDIQESWDFGQGAGFYLNATVDPWKKNYQMYSYLTQELPDLISKEFTVDINRMGIMGHSMGGHGALTIFLKNPMSYRSVSAFAPICAPMLCPWGQKAFSKYLGEDKEDWKQYDASELIKTLETPESLPVVLIDQGLSDQFLEEQLYPDQFEKNAKDSGLKLTLRRHADYDHSYYFISTYIEDHLAHHAKYLGL